MSHLKSGGETTADWLTINIVGENGESLFGTQQPVEALSPTETESIDSTKEDAISSYLDEEARAIGVSLWEFDLAQTESDVVLSLVITVEPSEHCDVEIKAVTRDLLPKVRNRTEQEEGILVGLYRITIQSGDGRTLVEYVVDASRNAVRAWSAEEVGPVWFDTQPSLGGGAE